MDKDYIMDSYALIAHFEDEPGGEKTRKILRAAVDGKARLFMSVINLGEVYYSTAKERGAAKANEILFLIDQLPIKIMDAGRDLTIEAAKLKSSHAVSYADCFAAALAIRNSAKVVTGDNEFKKFGETVQVEWI